MKRFWDKVNKSDEPDGCWLWQGSQTDGRGTFWFNKKNNHIKRFAFELTNGPIVDDVFIRSYCGNSLCVNPEHHYLRNKGDAEERFWEKVEKSEDGCWKWLGVKDWNGKGVFWLKNRMMYAHRIVWEKYYGLIPEGRDVLLSCSTTGCVNPEHLYLKSIDLEEKFWSKVNKNTETGCWEWIGSLNMHGYGQFQANRIPIGSHRFSWELKHGSIPNGLWVLHRCDNRKCVNPDHLFLGSNKENQIDSIKKGRRPEVRLTIDKAREIRKLYKLGKLNKQQLADSFGISYSHTAQIIKNGKWNEKDYSIEYY